MKNRKRKFRRILLAMLVFAVCLTAPAMASTRSKAIKGYKKFLSQKKIEWSEITKEKISTKLLEFSLIYIDRNDVPELVIYCPSHPSYRGRYGLYTWKNGKVKRIGYSGLDGVQYYEKTGTYRIRYNGIHGVTYTYYKLSNGKGVGKLYDNGSGQYYRINKNDRFIKINVFKYQESLRDLIGLKSLSEPVYYTNTAENRKLYLK